MKKITALVLFLGMCSGSYAAQASLAAKDFFRQAELQIGRRDYKGAIESYSKAIALSPRYAAAYLKRGTARRLDGDLDGAIEDYEKAHETDPRSTLNNRTVAEAFNNRGLIRTFNLDVEGAVADLDRAIEVFPGDADHFYKRGQAKLIGGELQGAVEDFNKALGFKHGGAHALIYAGRGYALLLQGKEAEAKRDFDTCIKLNKDGKLFLDYYLKRLEAQMVELRRRRAERLKKSS